jgi:choline dehydrogenase-like flavoprotein
LVWQTLSTSSSSAVRPNSSSRSPPTAQRHHHVHIVVAFCSTPPQTNLLLTPLSAGTSGCLLAHHLANSPAHPSVLVLEAGAKPSGAFLNAPAHRYHAAIFRPDLDHGYVSEPEPALNARTIAYTRGKGLGGSSLLNFGVYLKGSAADYDEWAQRVGDEAWRWDTVRRDYAAIETYEFDKEGGYEHLAQPVSGAHGTCGKVRVGLPPRLEKGVLEGMQALIDHGETINLDPNDGDPVGMSVFPYSYSKDGRSTSAIAHLQDAGDNLRVWTDASVTRLLWSADGDGVVGVQTQDGRRGTCV